MFLFVFFIVLSFLKLQPPAIGLFTAESIAQLYVFYLIIGKHALLPKFGQEHIHIKQSNTVQVHIDKDEIYLEEGGPDLIVLFHFLNCELVDPPAPEDQNQDHEVREDGFE